MTNRIAVLFVLYFFVDSQPWSMDSSKALRSSSFRIVSHISSATVQSGMALHDSVTLLVMCMCGISLFICLMVVAA